MRRGYFLIVIVFGIAAATFGQATAPDSRALQSLLTEVRGLRHDLQESLRSVHGSQILLARLQIQEMAVTRATQHLDEARAKLAEVQVVIKSEEAEIKHYEDLPASAEETSGQIEEAVNRAKADLAASKNVEEQRQAIETEAEQQLQTEQDKLSSLEAQLDELLKTIGNPDDKSDAVPN